MAMYILAPLVVQIYMFFQYIYVSAKSLLYIVSI